MVLAFDQQNANKGLSIGDGLLTQSLKNSVKSIQLEQKDLQSEVALHMVTWEYLWMLKVGDTYHLPIDDIPS